MGDVWPVNAFGDVRSVTSPGFGRGVEGPETAEMGDAGTEKPCTEDVGRLLGLVAPEGLGDPEDAGRRREAHDFLIGGGVGLGAA